MLVYDGTAQIGYTIQNVKVAFKVKLLKVDKYKNTILLKDADTLFIFRCLPQKLIRFRRS